MRIFEIETEEIYSADYSGCVPVSNPADLSDDNALYDTHRKNHGHIVFDDLFCKIGKIPNGTIIRHRGKQGQQDG
jgi:hypothetical protein